MKWIFQRIYSKVFQIFLKTLVRVRRENKWVVEIKGEIFFLVFHEFQAEKSCRDSRHPLCSSTF